MSETIKRKLVKGNPQDKILCIWKEEDGRDHHHP